MMRDWPRILIVDDMTETAEIVGQLIYYTLQDIEFTRRCSVQTAYDGKMALRLMRENGPFDLVMTDGSMPEMDGFQLARAIRAGAAEEGENGTSRHVIICMFTSFSSDADRDHALFAGCNSVISKHTVDDITQRVLELLKPVADEESERPQQDH